MSDTTPTDGGRPGDDEDLGVPTRDSAPHIVVRLAETAASDDAGGPPTTRVLDETGTEWVLHSLTLNPTG